MLWDQKDHSDSSESRPASRSPSGRRSCARSTQPLIHTELMGIHDHARLAKGIGHEQVGRLPPDPRQANQGFQVPGQLAPVPFDQRLAQGADVASLVAEEARGANGGLRFGGVGLCIVAGHPIAGEEGGGHEVDAAVGALRGENGRHGQFERTSEVQFAVGVRIGALEPVEGFSSARRRWAGVGGMEAEKKPDPLAGAGLFVIIAYCWGASISAMAARRLRRTLPLSSTFRHLTHITSPNLQMSSTAFTRKLAISLIWTRPSLGGVLRRRRRTP